MQKNLNKKLLSEKEFDDFIKKRPDALIPPEEKTYTDIKY